MNYDHIFIIMLCGMGAFVLIGLAMNFSLLGLILITLIYGPGIYWLWPRR